jgi:SAM-dependent methyltransferase
MLVPARRHDAEWMDREGNARADLEGALRDIRVVNRHMGGGRALLRAIEPFLDDLPAGDTLRVLDVGTGAADLPIAIVRRCRERGLRCEVVALERDPRTAAIAAEATADWPEIRVVRADAFDAPFGAAAFDLVTASMFFHHFPDDEAARLLRSLRGMARRAVVINDLRRHAVPWLFIWCYAHVTRRHPMFRNDAPLSVMRGFTGDELAELAAAAGAPGVRPMRRWPYRLLLTVPGAGAES